MSNRRGHFKAADIHKLKERVNHQCSRPGCKAPTSGPGSGQSVVTVGTAAHICAASPKGPRYDPTQSAVERNNIANAIWLCNNCAREIDLDPKKYTVDVLHQWKIDAEELAASVLGKRSASSDDNLAALSAALTGYSPSILWDSINKIHGATERAWEALDPRFKVVSSYRNGVQAIELHAQEEVQLQLTVQPEFLRDFAEKQKVLIQQGKRVEVNLVGFSISGSRLLESLIDLRTGKIVMSPRTIESRLKVYIHDAEGRLIDILDDVAGETTVGTELFNFKGTMFNRLFEINFSHPINGFHERLNLNINILLNSWESVDLNELPYFNKIHSLFKHLHDGYNLVLKMELSGESIFTTNIKKFDREDFIDDQYWFFSYIELCRKITKLLKINAHFREAAEFSWEEYDELEIVLARLEGKREFHTKHLQKNITCVMTIPAENRSFLQQPTNTSRVVKIIYPRSQTIRVFEQNIELPSLVRNLSNVVPKIVRILGTNAVEDQFEVEFIPNEDFLYSEKYEVEP